MRFLQTSIKTNLALLVLLALLPALVILFSSAVEQRQTTIAEARKNVFLLTHAMAEAQTDLMAGVRQIMATLALLPEVRSLDIDESSRIFCVVAEHNPGVHNLSLVDTSGNVIASNRPFTGVNLGDRRHFRAAREQKSFALGEYIVTRMGNPAPAFPVAYPVLGEDNQVVAVLTTAIDLSYLTDFIVPGLIEQEHLFLAATDQHGIRLFYYPPRATNPIGEPIREEAIRQARAAKGQSYFIGPGSDGVERLIAFEPVAWKAGQDPYMYVWAGLPESRIYGPLNAKLARDLGVMFLATLFCFFLAWQMGKRALLAPIFELTDLAYRYAEGDLAARIAAGGRHNEFRTLTDAFHDMAAALQTNRAALEESEERTRLILDSAAEGIYGLDREGNCTFCNRSCLDLLGYAAETELLGRNMHEMIHHTTRGGEPNPVANCEIFASFKSGRKIHVDGDWLWRADGSGFDAEFWSHPVSRNGEVIGAVVTFVDITERRAVEKALRENEERFQQMFREHDAIMLLIEPQSGAIIDANRSAANFYGYTIDQLQKMTIDQINTLPADEVAGARQKALQRQVNHLEFIHRLAGGELRTVEVHSSPIEVQERTLLFSIIRDVSDRKQLELEREQVREQMYHAQKLDSLGRLAGGIAHDLNNLLVPIVGLTDIVTRKVASTSPDAVPVLEQIEQAGQRSAKLVSQILDFSRRQKLDRHPVDLNRLIRNLKPMLRPLLESKTTMRLDLDENLPAVYADQGKLEQVVVNLVINARDAMPDGGQLQIRTSRSGSGTAGGDAARPSGQHDVKVCLQVIDNGCGIRDEVREQIFEPYFSTKEKGKGSGLGLSTVMGIIEQHGGSIQVDSCENEGSVFSIDLPAMPDADATEGQKPLPNLERLAGSETVLVVDDEQMVRFSVAENLRAAGYRVVLAEGGARALETLRRRQEAIDVVLTDMTMPAINGQELVQRLRELDAELPVIFMSGYANSFGDDSPPKERIAFLHKPFTPYELLSCLREVLDGSSTRGSTF